MRRGPHVCNSVREKAGGCDLSVRLDGRIRNTQCYIVFSLSRSSGVMSDFSHSVIRVVAVRLMLLGEKPLTMLGSISFSFAGDSGVVSSSSLLNLVVSYQSAIKLRGGAEATTYLDDDSSSFSGIEGVSSVAVVFTVEPLHREDLVDAGDSQFDQSVSSNESKPSGVQENRLFLTGLTLSLPASRVLAGGVGVAAREPARSKVVMTLGLEG